MLRRALTARRPVTGESSLALVRSRQGLSAGLLLSGCAVSSQPADPTDWDETAGIQFSQPPFRPGWAAMAEGFYQIEFLPDGYPGQRRADGTVLPHALYPIYVIDDWLAQYHASPTVELLSALRTVVGAAVARLDDFQGVLVAWYKPSAGGARMYDRHYSALTQAYCAVRLHRVGKLLDDPSLLEAAERTFRALLIPAKDGGVLYETAVECP